MSHIIICNNCKGNNVHNVNNEYICHDCGVVQSNILCDNTVSTYENDIDFSVRKVGNNTRIKKMQDWYMWSNDEKNTYKLNNYTKDLCNKLNIPENIIPSVCSTVVHVMNIIKKYDGTKRARVKDGIILTCLQYVLKDTHHQISAIELAKKINLDIKYITKADKIILELINCKKLDLKKQTVLDIKKPYQYVLDVINKKQLFIPNNILSQMQVLIQLCEDNDLLLDHTPLSVGVCCFYYILKLNNIPCDLKLFSELYDLSVVTVIKTYNKLKSHTFIIDQNNYLKSIV